jgi:hypothetical protein
MTLILAFCIAGVYIYTLCDIYGNDWDKIRKYGVYWDISLTIILPIITSASQFMMSSGFIAGFIFSTYRRKVLSKRGLKKEKKEPKKKRKTRRERALEQYYNN